MPVFDEMECAAPEFPERAWSRLEYGNARVKDGLLLPDTLAETKRIILLEKLRRHVAAAGGDFAVLNAFSDFRELTEPRRPDPTRSQWLWLYTQIGERHRILPLATVIGIMACRDALLPFLCSVPDKKIWDFFTEDETDGEASETEAFPYPLLEDAIQSDAPAKAMLYKTMARGVTEEQILDRAMSLEKPGIVATLLKTLPIDRRVRILIKAHTEWKDPLPLFQKAMEQCAPEIAAWRDPWGNGFFWYLYRRPVISRTLVESLPPEVVGTFNVKNRYGVSPEILWNDYRPVSNLITGEYPR